MRYWDASAIMPLLVADTRTQGVLRLVREDPVIITWWGTQIECVSAISRLEREGTLSPFAATAALARLELMADAWHEICPGDGVRNVAIRLLRVHPLRTADAQQLAAAIAAANNSPSSLGFVCYDHRLLDAARREGFHPTEP